MTPDAKVPGFTDTPILPGTNWHVHDAERPQPPVVTPGEGCAPPSDATSLFNGTDLAGWVGAADGEPAKWLVEDGHMEVVKGAGSIQTAAEFGDCQLHVEFACPAEVDPEAAFPGNSGVYMMGLYEVQVLDCFEHLIYADGTTGAMYGQVPPMANVCRKPGEWQSFDIVWEAHHFCEGKLVRPAFITVFHNGVLLHLRSELRGPTAYRTLTDYDEPLPNVGPLMLQNHCSDPVRFRNIWCRPAPVRDER